MKAKIFMTIMLLLLAFNYVKADGFDYPKSSDLIYPEYEVKLLHDHFTKLDEVISNQKQYDDNAIIDYVINYNYDISSYSNKMYSVIIINSLAMELEKNAWNLSKNKTVRDFISKYELLDKYDDSNIWNKFMTWIIMRKSFNDKTSDNLLVRRCDLLEAIILKNPKYAALASYLLNMVELYWPNTPHQAEIDIVFLNKFINDDYPNTEFAAKASTLLINKYIYLKKYDEATNECQKLFKNYKNFYTGVSDIYFDAYYEMMVMYNELKQKDNIYSTLEKLNKNSEGYSNTHFKYTGFEYRTNHLNEHSK